MKQIAHSTVEEILHAKETGVGETFYLYDTDPEVATPLFSL